MRIADRDIAALQDLGYTEREARFLYIVATHSGYFAPRQFLAFSRAKWSKQSQQFVEKLESRGHATWRDYGGTGAVYHLFSRTLYGVIGKANLRNRLRHSVDFIKTRLVLLDFVLENPECDYLETEQQKVRYFCEQLGVPKRCLPAKAYEGHSGSEPTLRYFVDKYPLFFDDKAASSPGGLTLSYVDSGQASLQGFRTHLKAYGSLFQRLADLRFLYISNSPAHFRRAEECFSSLVKVPLQTDLSNDVFRYFRLRNAWEAKRYGTFSNDDIEWLNEATERFRAEEFEGLFQTWAAGGLSECSLPPELVNPQRKVAFGTYLVNGGSSAATA